ncbi:hypothetical protein QR680_012241 [Steinernema hermaphroditum]|uniref:Chondroitin proteoglycan 4 domain-containing protein n=1 Tax=Steinernema hermaphroditum TaxID=289476 RepID=A0AA39I1E9_9BILA|nr:hypothetical protein QR680_012241 [Steinernema hermaphroditum]
MYSTFIIFGLFSKVMTSYLASDCIEPCIAQMQLVMESTPLNRNEKFGQLSWSQLLHVSQNKHITQDSFSSICNAYESVDRCLEDCEPKSENSVRIRQTYAGLRFICVDSKEEFFGNLPCLAQYEPLAMSQCQNSVNQSLISSNLFSESIINREQHNIRSRFGNLCKDLEAMIRCIEPVTRTGCGDAAAQMMLKFITVGFTSFEQLYGQLGITDQLPSSCRNLMSLSALSSKVGAGRRHNQKRPSYDPFMSTSTNVHLHRFISALVVVFSFFM